MVLSIIVILFVIFLLLGIGLGLFFLIRALLRGHKKAYAKTRRQEEMERMKIKDL